MSGIPELFESWANSANAWLFGPFKWVPDATGFYDNNVTVLTILAFAYIPVVFGLKAFMKDRQAFDLRLPLAGWSFLLTVFSFVGALYTVPVIINNFATKPLLTAICDPSCYTDSAARWVFFFNVSKFFEFIDTIFIVLRKKPLIFLHWYHHIMTCIYCWYANQISCGWNCTGWSFAAMNLVVHTLMYGHYTLTALNIRANWNVLLTSLQLLQMVVGTAIVIYSALYCPNAGDHQWGSLFALIMYFSYFVLFANFFVKRYCGGAKRDTRPKNTIKKDQ